MCVVVFVPCLYDDGWCGICRSGLNDRAVSSVRSPIRRQSVVSLIVIAGVSTADGEAAADESSEYDEKDDPAGNLIAGALAVAVVVTIGARTQGCGDDQSHNGEHFE